MASGHAVTSANTSHNVNTAKVKGGSQSHKIGGGMPRALPKR